jgi:hypothetical protein
MGDFKGSSTNVTTINATLVTADDLEVDSTTLSVDADNNKVGIGLTSPKTKLTVEGTLTLKEQANAEADTAAYGQLWVKSDTPNDLYFTNDAGNDVRITNGAGLAAAPGASVAADDINVGDNNVSVSGGSGHSLTLNATAATAQLKTTTSGEVDITSAANIDINAATTLTIDSADDSNLTVTASGKDLDIAVAGGGTQELRLASAGTGASAIHLNASAGGVNIDSADMIDIDAADEITIDTTSADGHIAITSAHTSGQSILISANADAGAILDIDAGILDVDIQAAATIDAVGIALGAGSGELDLTTTGTLDVNANALDMDLTDSSSITITSSEAAEDLTIEQVGANDSSIIIQAAGTGTDAIRLNASAGSLDIDAADNITIDAADEISIATTSGDGHITLTSAHTAGVAFHIDANANADSEVQIDAGILDIDVTGAATLDATSMTTTAATQSIVASTSLTVTSPSTTITSTTSGKAIFIDHDNTATTTVTPVGIHIDFDKSGVSGNSVTSTFTGLDIDVNDAATNHSGADVTQTGASIAVASANDTGTTLNLGMQISATGAGENIQLALVDDASVIAFGVDSDIILTHEADRGLILSQGTETTAEPVFTIKNVGNFASGGGIEFIADNGAGEADGDILGFLSFKGDDDGDAATQYAQLSVLSSDVTNNDEGGQFKFEVMANDGGASNNHALTPALNIIGGLAANAEVVVNDGGIDLSFRVETDGEDEALLVDGTNNKLYINKGETAFETIFANTNDEAMRIDANGVIFNEDGHATNDFRVEGDNDSHLLFVDAGADKVSIGVSTDGPSAILEVAGDADSAAPVFKVVSADVDQVAVEFALANTTAIGIDIAGSNTTTEVMKINADGLTSGDAMTINSNSSDNTARSLLKLHNNHASATGTSVIEAVQDSTGPILDVSYGSVGSAMKLKVRETTHTCGTDNNNDEIAAFFTAGMIPIALGIRVTTAITNNAYISKLGTINDDDSFGIFPDGTLEEAGDNLATSYHPASATGENVKYFTGNHELRITYNATPGAGALRLVLYYYEITPPTS